MGSVRTILILLFKVFKYYNLRKSRDFLEIQGISHYFYLINDYLEVWGREINLDLIFYKTYQSWKYFRWI